MSGSRFVHVGTPSSDFKEWTATEVGFHKFTDLTTTRDEYEESPEFSSLGHQWTLVLAPGGEEDNLILPGDVEEMVGVYLLNVSDESIKIEYGYSVKDAAGKEVVHKKPKTVEFAAWVFGSSGNNMRGYKYFAKRSKIMKSLVNGSLVIEVRMRIVDTNKSAPQFIPTNQFCKNVMELFDDEESADVVFEIGGHHRMQVIIRGLKYLPLIFMPIKSS